MDKMTSDLYRWGEWKMGELGFNPYSDTNTLYRAGYLGGSDGGKPSHRILCYDPKEDSNIPRFVLEINAAWNTLSNRPQQCTFGKYVLTQMIDANTGRKITSREAASFVGVSYDTFKRNASRGRREIQTKIYG